MKYEIKNPLHRVQAPELGTLGLPREGSNPKGQDALVAWAGRAEENAKTVILSIDVVALLLVEGTAKAIDRTWSKLEVLIDRISSQNQRVASEGWRNPREADLTGH
jgi:hypothetical protein